MDEWLEAFTGSQLKAEQDSLKGSAGVTLKRYVSENHTQLAYIASDQKDPEHVIVVYYNLKTGCDNPKLEKVIAQSAASISLFPAKKMQNSKKQLVTTKTKRKKEWSDKYLESREKVIDNIKNLKDWWYLETENYVLCSNLKKKSAANQVQLEIENGRTAYSTLLPVIGQIDDVSVARVFEKRDDYLAYVGPELQWSGGVWMPAKKELVVSPCDYYRAKDRVAQMVRVIYHEAFHQYLFYATGECYNSVWFNEGFAQLFADLDFKAAGKFTIKPDSRKFDRTASAINSPLGSASKLIALSPGEFYSAGIRDNAYPCSWALMYFLVKGAPVMKGKEAHSAIPGKYYKAIVETRNAEKATKIAWEGIDMEQFDKDWHEFWASKTLFNKSKHYDCYKSLVPADEKADNAPPASNPKKAR